MKQFDIPTFYRSSVLTQIKTKRKTSDNKKKDFSPTSLEFGPVTIKIARHFGFCYGVENAIEISFRAIAENPNKRIFLLSQMIHNQEVNKDLQERGVRFLMNTNGEQLIPWTELQPTDIVIIPAFGTTLAIQEQLTQRGVQVEQYNTTCPFVEKVWNRSEKLGQDGFTIVIHGKHNHEETRATFSRSETHAPSIVIKDLHEAKLLSEYIQNGDPNNTFHQSFKNRYSNGFNPAIHLQKLGVINQTTMLATETKEIAEYLRTTMVEKYGVAEIKNHFSDTRDTLCYATNENQESTLGLLAEKADLALVVGGYNSSNTSHLVELCEQKLPTYFISSADEIKPNGINHFDIHHQQVIFTPDFITQAQSHSENIGQSHTENISQSKSENIGQSNSGNTDAKKSPITIILTSGASCPDVLVEGVLNRILEFFPDRLRTEDVLEKALG